MTPLVVIGTVGGAITVPPMLDALLAGMVCADRGLIAGFSEMVRGADIEIPLALEPGRRFHMCSSPISTPETYELRHLHRRFPIHEAQMLGDKRLRRINVAGGPTKSFRIPQELTYLRDDTITWWCIGDADAIREMLVRCTHLGKKRSVGRGIVTGWSVREIDPWPGFPVLTAEGKPLRPLPLDHPGLVEPAHGYATLTFPYWERQREELCAVPG